MLFAQKPREIGGRIMLSSAVFLISMKNSWDGCRKPMNSAIENKTDTLHIQN